MNPTQTQCPFSYFVRMFMLQNSACRSVAVLVGLDRSMTTRKFHGIPQMHWSSATIYWYKYLGIRSLVVRFDHTLLCFLMTETYLLELKLQLWIEFFLCRSVSFAPKSLEQSESYCQICDSCFFYSNLITTYMRQTYLHQVHCRMPEVPNADDNEQCSAAGCTSRRRYRAQKLNSNEMWKKMIRD